MITIRKDIQFNTKEEVQEFLEKELLGKIVTVSYYDEDDVECFVTGKIDKIVFQTVTKFKGVLLFFSNKRVLVDKDELFNNIKILN